MGSPACWQLHGCVRGYGKLAWQGRCIGASRQSAARLHEVAMYGLGRARRQKRLEQLVGTGLALGLHAAGQAGLGPAGLAVTWSQNLGQLSVHLLGLQLDLQNGPEMGFDLGPKLNGS